MQQVGDHCGGGSDLLEVIEQKQDRLVLKAAGHAAPQRF